MQRIADEIAKARRSRKPEGRKVTTPKTEDETMGEPESRPVDAGEATPPVAQDTSTEVAAPLEGEAMAKAKRSRKTSGRKAKKSAAKKAKRSAARPTTTRRKAAAAPTGDEGTTFSLTAFPDDATKLKIVDVRSEEKNRYINVYFADGFYARLQPANLDQKDTLKCRDAMVAYLRAKLL